MVNAVFGKQAGQLAQVCNATNCQSRLTSGQRLYQVYIGYGRSDRYWARAQPVWSPLSGATQTRHNQGRRRGQTHLHDLSRRKCDTFYVAAHPSTTEEHTKRSDEARAGSLNRDTSDDYLQEETEQNRSRKAKSAFNIVFVTSEV